MKKQKKNAAYRQSEAPANDSGVRVGSIVEWKDIKGGVHKGEVLETGAELHVKQIGLPIIALNPKLVTVIG